MKQLENVLNAPPPDIDYPNSRIKDESNPGVGNGVPVNEEVWGDSMQFFQKLLIDASITANGNFDNFSNGYQTIEALIHKIQNNISPTEAWVVDNFPSTYDALYRRAHTNTIQLKLQVLTGFLTGVTIFVLPAGYRPSQPIGFSIGAGNNIIIQPDGIVKNGVGTATIDATYSFFEFPID